jgi:hypothetical protein
MNGDRTIMQRNENPPMSLSRRLRVAARTHFRSTADITQTEKDAYQAVREIFTPLYDELKQLIEVDLKNLENNLEEIRAPWTPGRLPEWNH